MFMYGPVFCSRTCIHARHVILMVLHVLYQAIISNEIYLMCDALCDDCFPRSFCYFFFYAHFAIYIYIFLFSFQPQIVLNLFLFFGRFEPHCSY